MIIKIAWGEKNRDMKQKSFDNSHSENPVSISLNLLRNEIYTGLLRYKPKELICCHEMCRMWESYMAQKQKTNKIS